MNHTAIRILMGTTFLLPSGALAWSILTRDLPVHLVFPVFVISTVTFLVMVILIGLLTFLASPKFEKDIRVVQVLSFIALALSLITHFLPYEDGTENSFLWYFPIGMLFALSVVWSKYEFGGREDSIDSSALDSDMKK